MRPTGVTLQAAEVYGAVGLGIDYLIRGRTSIYRPGDDSSTASARLSSMIHLITRNTKGLSFVFAF